MAPPSKIQSVDEARRWFEEGLTYQEMADRHEEKYGIKVTAAAFASLRRRMGWENRILRGYDPLVPWDVRPEHRSTYTYWMLRREVRRRAGITKEDGEGLAALDRWIAGLREAGAVVDYRPDSKEGFFLTYARPGKDTDLIREPDE